MASLDLSLRLLATDEPQLAERWRDLAVCPAAFDADAAAAIWDDAATAAEALLRLYDLGFLEPGDAPGRFRLHDLMRELARRGEPEEQLKEPARRHAHHFERVLRTADALYLDGDPAKLAAGLALFDRERAQIEAGHAWALRSAKTNADAAALASAYPDAGVYVLALRLHPREWIALFEAALERARRAGDRRGRAATSAISASPMPISASPAAPSSSTKRRSPSPARLATAAARATTSAISVTTMPISATPAAPSSSTSWRWRSRLAQFNDFEAVMQIVSLPLVLMEAAENGPASRLAGLAAMHAAALVILLSCPMRAKNLAGLDLDRHVIAHRNGTHTIYTLRIEGSEVKNGETVEVQLNPRNSQLLHRYITRFRPLIFKGGTALFPRQSDGAPRTPAQLAADLKALIYRYTGLVVHVHLFRHLAAKLYLAEQPGDFETVPQADKSAWEALFAQGDIFDGAGPCRGWSDATRVMRQQGYGPWLSFLCRTDPGALSLPPAERVTEAHARAYFQKCSARLKPKSVENLFADLFNVIRAMAPPRDCERLRVILNRLNAQTNRHALPPPIELTAGEIFRWGLNRMTEVEADASIESMWRAIRFRQALMISLLAARPVRRRTLMAMCVDSHLVPLNQGFELRFAAEDTKDRRARSFSLPAQLEGAMRCYLAKHRLALLNGPRSPFLWISHHGKPMQPGALTHELRRITERLLGAALGPHAFRHIAATSIAEFDPEHVNIIRDLLCHATLDMPERHYNRATGLSSCTRVQSIVEDIRRAVPRMGRANPSAKRPRGAR